MKNILCFTSLVLMGATVAATPPPNVLFITADDLGLQLGCCDDTVIEKDPWEFHNLAGKAEYAEVEKRMKATLTAWRHETDDPALDPGFHDQIKQQFASPKRRGGATRE